MKITWTKKGRNSFENNIDYILVKWGEKVTVNFINESYRVFGILVKNPHAGFYSEDFSANMILVVKQIYLIYDIKNNEIIIKNFWDNRQKPIKKLDI